MSTKDQPGNRPPHQAALKRKRRLLGWLGCGWMVLAAPGCANRAHSHAQPSHAEPVTAAMMTDCQTTRAGETLELSVRVRIAGGYHIYSNRPPHGPFSPTTLVLRLPEELEAVGDWLASSPTTTKTGEEVYIESVLFRRRLKVRSNAGHKVLSIKADLLYQACNDELCWPPGKIRLSASVAVVSEMNK